MRVVMCVEHAMILGGNEGILAEGRSLKALHFVVVENQHRAIFQGEECGTAHICEGFMCA